MSPAEPRSQGGLIALQGLRGLAALLVVADHAIIAGSDAGLLGPSHRPFAAMVGLLGVYTFFVISGFIMIAGHFDDFAKPGAARRFLSRRIVRIVPLYWLITIAMCFAKPEFVSAKTLILSLLFIPHQSLQGDMWWPIFALGWTLQYEMFFYLLVALALGLPRNVGLALIAAAMTGLSLAGAAGLAPRGTLPGYYADPVILLLFAGAVLGAASRWKDDVKLRVNPGLGLAAAILVLTGACAILFLVGATGPSPHIAMAAAAVLATVACALPAPRAGAHWYRPVFEHLGDSSYSLYLTHAFVVFGVAGAGVAAGFSSFLAIAIAFSVLVGFATYRWVERPLLRSIGRAFGQTPRIGGRLI